MATPSLQSLFLLETEEGAPVLWASVLEVGLWREGSRGKAGLRASPGQPSEEGPCAAGDSVLRKCTAG